MKALAAIVPLMLVVGCYKYDGHADGEMSVDVEVIVSDSGGTPIEGIRVTFFSRQDQMQLQLIDALRVGGESKLPSAPDGVTVVTGRNGKAVLSCRFDAAFLFRDRPGNVVRSEWRPGGLLQIESAGFKRHILALADEFPSPPYTGTVGPHPISIELEKEGQQGG